MISVIMSCHKSNPKYLRESILSILNQTYTDFEFLIANNEVDFDLKSFLDDFHDKRIKYIDNGVNIGPAVSYNKLANMAKGEYVALQDHDDISLPNRLVVEKKALDHHPEIASVSSKIHIFGNFEKNDGYYIPPEKLTQELIFWQPIKQPTFMKRKSFCEKYKYSTNWMIYDFEFWSRTRHIPHLIIDDVLLKYRKTAGNSTNERWNNIRKEHAEIIRINLFPLRIYASAELCKALDPFNKQCSANCLQEFEFFKDELLKYVSKDLYERKRKEIISKIHLTNR